MECLTVLTVPAMLPFFPLLTGDDTESHGEGESRFSRFDKRYFGVSKTERFWTFS
jgi:hypothetical protein